jgi:hypothetical protein
MLLQSNPRAEGGRIEIALVPLRPFESAGGSQMVLSAAASAVAVRCMIPPLTLAIRATQQFQPWL